jgi:hypothetical protein
VRAAEMLANGDPSAPRSVDERTSLAQMNELGRRIEEARRVLHASAPEVITDLEARVASYWAALEDAGASDELVVRYARRSLSASAGAEVGIEPSVSVERSAWGALRILTLPLAVIGMILYWLPYQLPRAVTQRLHGDPDVTSTYKLGIGLLVHPLWAAIAITVAFLTLDPSLAMLATAVVLTSPFAALPWLDRWDRLSARVGLLAPREDRQARLVTLAAARAALMNELETARIRAFGA